MNNNNCERGQETNNVRDGGGAGDYFLKRKTFIYILT